MTEVLDMKIMAEVGFGGSPMWHVGGTCLDVRRKAVEALPKVIAKYANAEGGDQEIAPPNKWLMALAKEISDNGEDTRYTVEHTYRAFGAIIQAHMEAVAEPASKRSAFFKARCQAIRNKFLKKSGPFAKRQI